MAVISVIIPVYNVSPYIEMCLCSCSRQSFNDIEMIVINDGSVDDSLEIVRRYAENDKRIKIIDQKNEGIIKAREVGVANSSGKYLFFLDGDDFLPIDTLINLHEKAIDFDVDLVVANNYVFNYNCQIYQKEDDLFLSDQLMSGNELLTFLLEKRADSLWGKLINRNIYVSAYNENIFEGDSYGEDQIIMMNLLQKVKNTYCWSGYSYGYVIHANSLLRETDKLKLVNRYYYYAVSLFKILDSGLYKKDISLKIYYRAFEALCLCLRYVFIIGDRKKILGKYLKINFVGNSEIRHYIFQENKFIFLMLCIQIFSPKLSTYISVIKRSFRRYLWGVKWEL